MTSDELVKVLARPPNFTQDLIKARETGLQQRALAHALTLEKREEGPSTKLAGLGKDAAAAKRQ